MIKSLHLLWIPIISILLIILAFMSPIYFAYAETNDKNATALVKTSNTAALLDIKGAIGPAVDDFFHRALQKAIQANDRIIILRIDTPGGLSQSMRNIIQGILSSPIPFITYVAPSGARAASAGTYILYASHIAAMAPGTNLGAATPVSITVPGDKDREKEKTKSSSELKAISDAKAYIRSLAQLRKRNVEWAEKAVSVAESLSAEEALNMKVIDIVARNITDLLNQANGKKVIVQDNEKVLHTVGLRVQEILPDWRVKFLTVITDPSVAYILLMIGFYGLFFEFANPGFVAPGVIGAICLLVSLYALQLLPINYAGLALILLGMGFIVAEMFMPSFGVLGIGGAISFVIGSILLIKTDVFGFGIPLHLIIFITMVTVIFFLGILQLAFRAHRRRSVSGAEHLLNQIGVIEEHNNKLWVKIEGELWKVTSQHELHSGQIVEVIRVEGLTLHVVPRETK